MPRGGVLLLLLCISDPSQSSSEGVRKGRQFAAENSEDPFVVGISPEFNKVTQFVKSDYVPESPIGYSQPIDSSDTPLPQFYRGNIEANANPGRLLYYGAAKPRNKLENLITKSSPYRPTRQSVEARPDTTLGRSAQLQLREKNKFRQSRPYGHSIAYSQYKAIRKEEDYKIVCYYGAWSVYRPSPFNFGIADIDPFSCTHLIYSFAGLDPDSLTIISLDKEEDIVKGSYKSAIGLKKQNPKLKVMLAIGGWNEGGKTYSSMAKTAESRKKFIDSVVEFLSEHNFDGFDLDWEYPGAQDRDGSWNDKQNFADLVEELAEAFKPRNWLLSAAVSPAKFRVNDGYDVKRIAKHLNFINVMTYDLHGSWDRAADHHAPLHKREHDDWNPLTTDSGLSYWHQKGAPLHKLMLGTPFYGRSFTLKSSNSKPGAASSGDGGTPGKYTEEAGFLSYYEICLLKKQGGWTEKTDSDGNPYMVKGNQWIGYDTPASIKRKMKYVKEKNLGGAMIWAIDLDDYVGACGSKWPLLSTMNHELRRKNE